MKLLSCRYDIKILREEFSWFVNDKYLIMKLNVGNSGSFANHR